MEGQATGGTAVTQVERAKDAYQRHAWTEALEAFDAADQAGGLDPDALEQMGEAAWWAGRPDAADDAFERAFEAYVAAGRPLGAANVAVRLTYLGFRRLAYP